MNRKVAAIVFLAAMALFAVATMKPRLELGEAFEGIFFLLGISFAALAVVLVAVGLWFIRQH